MEGYIKLNADEFVTLCNALEEDLIFLTDLFGPPWHYGDDGNLYIQEVR